MSFNINSLFKTVVSKSVASVFIISMSMATSTTVMAGPQTTPQATPGTTQQSLSPEQQAVISELEALQQELQTTQYALQGIQQKAFEKNPTFVKQRDELQALVFKKMSAKDYNAEAEAEALQSIASKYQSGSAEPTEQEVLDFSQRDESFQERQQKALQDPEVQKKSLILKDDVEAAMNEINPETKTLMAKMETASKRFMELRQKVMGQ